MLHLEKDKRDLEQSLQLMRRSQEKVESESQSARQKLTEQLHTYRKEVAKLKEVRVCTYILNCTCRYVQLPMCICNVQAG